MGCEPALVAEEACGVMKADGSRAVGPVWSLGKFWRSRCCSWLAAALLAPDAASCSWAHWRLWLAADDMLGVVVVVCAGAGGGGSGTCGRTVTSDFAMKSSCLAGPVCTGTAWHS